MKTREAEVLADLMAARADASSSARPSVETLLHNLFPQKYVVHTHPTLVNALTCAEEGKKYAKKIFGPGTLWLPPAEPGYILSKRVKELLDKHVAEGGSEANVLFLENHGVFVAADSVDEIKNLYDNIINKIKENAPIRPDFADVPESAQKDAVIGEIRRIIPEYEHIICFNNAELSAKIKSAEAFYDVSGAYTPDHMVYYKRSPLFTEGINALENDIKTFEAKNGFLPRVIAVRDEGVFACAPAESQAWIIKLLFLDAVKISVYAKNFGGPKFMPGFLVDFIENWEAESYRFSKQE